MDAKELLYAETHEWVHVAEEHGVQTATIGISAFAVEQLTDLVYLELPQVGRQLSAGEEFGEVESVKAVSPLYCPITGQVVQVNTALPDQLEMLNQDPYGAGWIAKIKITDEGSLAHLMRYEAYQKQCTEAGH